MSYKYITLNLLLLVVVFMVAIENYDTWSHPIELVSDNHEIVKKPAIKIEAPPPLGITREPASPQSFILIAEKNIFSTERKDFPVLAVEKSNPATRPQVVLYGVTLAGEYQAASFTSPGRPLRKGERETLTIKIGEKVGEYRLAKVSPDRIMLENNGDSFEVLLYDPRNPKKRMEAKIEVKPSTVASTQTTLAPPSSTEPAPAATSSPSSIEKPKEPQPQIVPTPPLPATRFIPPLWQRRRGIQAYPPTSPPTGVPGQATQ